MKVEFLQTGSVDCPLIRIYGDEPEICQNLLRGFQQLAAGHEQEITITDLPGIEIVGGCRIIAQVAERDRGVVRRGESAFSWELTTGTWDNVAFLIEPFCRAQAGGWQWLDQVPASDARVLISTSGCW